MADNDQQVHPMQPTKAEQAVADPESAAAPSEKPHLRKKSMKRLAYVTTLVIILTAVILAFALTIMHVKNPKFRLHSIEVESLSFTPSATSPSFSMRLDAELAIKNTNFGHYEYESSTVTLAYRGANVGEAVFFEGRAGARSTKEIEVNLAVSSSNVSSDSNLASDLNSGTLTLTSHGKLSGEVHLLELFKKRKAPEMNCTIKIDLVNEEILDWNCSS